MNGFLDNLFRPGLINQGRPISIVHDPDATMTGLVEPGEDSFVVMGAPERRQFAVEPAAIRRRQTAGASLWDGTLLYAADLSLGPAGSTRVTAGACNFYSYVTVADRIQAALLEPDKPRHQALLEHNLSSVSAIAMADYEPVCLAAATTCVFETDDGPLLLLTERAEEVVNALGTYCVIPTFGLESPVVDGVRSEYGTVFYNFAKEFLEEVYGQEELIRAATSESLDPDAIFESNQARSLLDQFGTGTARSGSWAWAGR